MAGDTQNWKVVESQNEEKGGKYFKGILNSEVLGLLGIFNSRD